VKSFEAAHRREAEAGASAVKNIVEYIRIYIAVTNDRRPRWGRGGAITIDR